MATDSSIAMPLWEKFPVSAPEVDPDAISYEVMRYPEAAQMTDELIRKISASREQFDTVVYPLRGGLYPGTKVAEKFGYPVYPIGLKLYQGIQAGEEVKGQNVTIWQPLPPNVDFSGQRILVIDDVNHTSTSLGVLEAYLCDKKVASITFGVLHEKPAFASKKADYVVRWTNAWIVYPWEHLGDNNRERWEFFAEKFPIWMLRDDGKETNWSGCLEKARQIGFREEELPSLNRNNFYNRLYVGLQERSQKLRGQELTDQEIQQMLL